MPKPQDLNSFPAKRIAETLGELSLEMTDAKAQLAIQVPKERIAEVCLALRDDPKLRFDQMMDLTAVDYLRQKREERFQVVYHLFSLPFHHRVRVKCDVPENEARLPSIHHVWKAANWYERECFDMYGIRFDGHPDLKRLLMYEGFEGHPLRKDYPITRQQPRLPLVDVPERHDYRMKATSNAREPVSPESE